MKVNRLIFICLLLAVLTVGAVSAADNVTDEMSFDGEVNVDSSIDDANSLSQSDEAALKGSEVWDMDVDGTIDVFQDENQEITIGNYPDDAKGNFSLKINDVDVECTKEQKSVMFDASNLSFGQHDFVLNFLGDDKYEPTAKSGMLIVRDPLLTKEIFAGGDLYLEYWDDDGIDIGNLPLYDYENPTEEDFIKCNHTRADFEINGTAYYAYPAYIYDWNAGMYIIMYYVPLKSLPCGNYAAKLDLHNEHSRTYNLSVIPYRLDIGENNQSWVYGDNDCISFFYSKNLTGYIRVNVSSKEVYNGKVDLGAEQWSQYANVSHITMSEFLDWGINEVSFEYYGGNYPNYTEKVNVTFSYTLGLINTTEYLFMNTNIYFFNAPIGLSTDKLSVIIDGIEWKDIDYDPRDVLTGYVEISNLDAGNHSIAVSYEGDDKFYPLTERAYIYVTLKITIPDAVVNEKDEMVVNGKNEIVVSSPVESGTVHMDAESDHDFYDLSVELVNGQAKLSLAHLNGGAYYISFYEIKNDINYWQRVIVKNTKLTAKDTSMYYKSGSSFKVKVTDYKGKVVKSKYVKFYINGKYVKKVKTNKNGYAILKIGKVPGKYDITAEYGKIKITRKLTVKHVVTLKTVTVKKSAKKLVLKATLKQGKKALKYKRVTFKFNGKTYKAKTNKYGVAKVTVKKSVLKKLKVGKKVTYQATYVKDTVKKSAKVRR